jgi:hypothetical protein
MALSQKSNSVVSSKHWMIIARILIESISAKDENNPIGEQLSFSVCIEDFYDEQEPKFT